MHDDGKQGYDSTTETIVHIRTVQEHINGFCIELMARATNHDESKLREPEKRLFDELTPILRTLEYGSPEYKESLARLKPALDHHYSANSHHPEHYSNGIDDMTLVDIIEMYCDWQAAVQRTKNGDFSKSIEINTKRFNMSPQLAKIFMNTHNMAPYFL
jgi:hypothetical protein